MLEAGTQPCSGCGHPLDRRQSDFFALLVRLPSRTEVCSSSGDRPTSRYTSPTSTPSSKRRVASARKPLVWHAEKDLVGALLHSLSVIRVHRARGRGRKKQGIRMISRHCFIVPTSRSVAAQQNLQKNLTPLGCYTRHGPTYDRASIPPKQVLANAIKSAKIARAKEA